MSRYQLSKPGQPPWTRILLAVVDSAASLKLAVTLILSCAVGLGWATFVESEYGTPAVQYGVYGSPLFSLLLLLLAINIFSAAAVRFPWKKHQTGFVITHIGLLVLLFGCLLTRRDWIDAQMPIFEDHIGYQAYTNEHHFQLVVRTPDTPHKEQVIEVPFQAGPFNWNDYDRIFQLVGTDPVKAQEFTWVDQVMNPLSLAWRNTLRVTSGIAFSIASRDRGVVWDENGVKLEVLDYYANSRPVVSPTVEMKITSTTTTTFDDYGKPIEVEGEPQSFQLRGNRMFPDYYPAGTGVGGIVGGGRFTFRPSSSKAETQAFLDSKPSGELDQEGQVVLFIEGKSYPVNIGDLGEEPTLVGDTGIGVKLVRREANGSLGRDPEHQRLRLGPTDSGEGLPGGPAVQLELFQDAESLGHLILFADRPEFNIQRHNAESDVYGTYWVDQSDRTDAQVRSGTGGSRIDVLLADDNETLYYRYWNRKEVAALAELPTDGSRVDAFKMPFAQLRMYVDQFVPRTSSGVAHLPIPFNIDTEKRQAHLKRPAVQLRLTLGEGDKAVSEEFWLGSIIGDGLNEDPTAGEIQTVSGGGKQVAVTMQPTDAFTDANFQVRLRKFHRKLDPGTEQAAFYGSTIDVLSRDPENPDAPGEMLHENIRIMMNVPYDVVDPKTGRTYRLFQESFNGPWKPGDPVYEQHADKSTGRDQFYRSVLTVNYDPGRAAKYLGCLLICAGIFTMFYMRAYFFKPAGRPNLQGGQDEGEPASDAQATDAQKTNKRKRKVAAPTS